MTRSSIIIGIIMIAAAVMFYYFDDSLALRIIAGAIFVVGAVLMYYSITTPAKEQLEDEDEEESPHEEEQPLYTYSESEPTEEPEPSGPKSPLGDPNLMSATAETRQEEQPIPREETPIFSDPKEEFDYLTRKLLAVLKEHLMAHTVGMYWINTERRQIIIGEFVTDSRNFTNAKRVNLAADFISRIGTEGRPEIVSEINPASELDLLPYYVDTEGVQSFVGVPVYFMGDVIAVVAADSKAPDSFGRETITSVNHFVALIISLLQSYNQKFDLMSDASILKVIDTMQGYIESHFDSYGIASATTRAVSEALDWDHVALVLSNPEKHGWSVVKSQTKSSSLPYVTEGSGVDLERSVLRQVIDRMEGMIIASPKAPAFRFHEKENIESRGQIIAVPLATHHKCYGLLAVEYREAGQYAQKDLALLERIAMHASNAFEIVSLRELTGKHLLVDEISHLPSRGYLLYRLREETARITGIGGKGVFLVVSVDRPEEIIARHGDAAVDSVMYQIGKHLPEYAHPYDFAGKVDDHTLGMFMVEAGADDAYLRAEKLRKAITALAVPYGDITFSVSVSVAGCVVHQGMDTDAVFRLVKQVLDRAISDGGNTVKIV